MKFVIALILALGLVDAFASCEINHKSTDIIKLMDQLVEKQEFHGTTFIHSSAGDLEGEEVKREFKDSYGFSSGKPSWPDHKQWVLVGGLPKVTFSLEEGCLYVTELYKKHKVIVKEASPHHLKFMRTDVNMLGNVSSSFLRIETLNFKGRRLTRDIEIYSEGSWRRTTRYEGFVKQ